MQRHDPTSLNQNDNLAENDDLVPPPTRKSSRILKFFPLSVLLIGGIVLWFILGLDDVFSFSALRTHRLSMLDWVRDNRDSAIMAYMAIYVLAVAFSLPAGTFLTIVAGFLFGPFIGGSIALVSATIGSFIVFYAARTAFRDLFRSKAEHFVGRMRHHFEEQAFSYLLFLRLVPIFPFWIINIVPAFTNVSGWTFILATFFGALPATFIFASFGSGLGKALEIGVEPGAGLLLEPSVFLPLLGLGFLVMIPVIYRNRRFFLKLFKVKT